MILFKIRIRKEEYEMKCVEKCQGTINEDLGILLQSSPTAKNDAFPCDVCGRLHFVKGHAELDGPVGVNFQRAKAYLIKGKVVHR